MTQKTVFMEEIFTLRNLRSMGAAVVVEILLALGVAAILVWQQMHPVTPPAPIGDPVSVITPQPVPQHHSVPVPQPQRPQLQPFSEVPSIPTPLPAPTTEPVQPPPVPAQSQPPQGLVNDFARLMLHAINEQKLYPKGPMLKGETGQTVVSFDYVDGVVGNIRVDKSSGIQELDDAAVAAVQNATLPPKPAELANLTRFVFTLAFNIGD